MKVNLKQVPPDGRPFNVACTLDLSALKFWGEHPIPRPVQVNAVFRNENGILRLNYRADYSLEGPCARCLKPVSRLSRLAMEHILIEKLENEKNDAFIVVPDARLDLDELVFSDVSLSLAGVLLCDDGCAGLCPTCGCNRAEGCDCEAPADRPESAFGAFKALFGNE